MKIILDPGHGQLGNRYPANTSFYEGTQMFLLANYLKEELEAYADTQVIITRKTVHEDPGLTARGEMARGADAFLSLHSNAIGSIGTSAVRGVEIYYTMLNPTPNKILADKLMDTIAKAMGTSKRFTTTKGMPADAKRDYFGVVRAAAEAKCPISMLIEHGYHTNPEDTKFLVNFESLKALAKAEAVTIAAHFGLKLKTQENQKDEEQEVKKLSPYNLNNTKAVMVTCGAYATEAKATEVLARVQMIYPEAGLRKEQSAVTRHQVVAGRHIGTAAEARIIAEDLQLLTGIASEAWTW